MERSVKTKKELVERLNCWLTLPESVQKWLINGATIDQLIEIIILLTQLGSLKEREKMNHE